MDFYITITKDSKFGVEQTVVLDAHQIEDIIYYTRELFLARQEGSDAQYIQLVENTLKGLLVGCGLLPYKPW